MRHYVSASAATRQMTVVTKAASRLWLSDEGMTLHGHLTCHCQVIEDIAG